MAFYTTTYTSKDFPNFNAKSETLANQPNLLLTLVVFFVMLALMYVAVNRVRKSKTPKEIAYNGEVLQLAKTEHGQIFVQPPYTDTEEKKVITKLEEGMLIDLEVPHHFQAKYKTTRVIRARCIDPRRSKMQNGEKILESWGFVFPDYYKIGALTFTQIVNESQLSLVDYIENQFQTGDEEIFRPEPERKFLTTA